MKGLPGFNPALREILTAFSHFARWKGEMVQALQGGFPPTGDTCGKFRVIKDMSIQSNYSLAMNKTRLRILWVQKCSAKCRVCVSVCTCVQL